MSDDKKLVEQLILDPTLLEPKTFMGMLISRQRQLQVDLGQPMLQARKLPTLSQHVRENVLALIVEATEILAEVQWKPWKASVTKAIDYAALTFEVVDAFQFLTNIVNALGLSEKDLMLAYEQKLKENYRRLQAGESGVKDE